MITATNQLGKHKIALVDHLYLISNLNAQIGVEKNQRLKKSMINSKNSEIKVVKTLIPHLNSVGKLSDKETKSLLSLDLMNMKNFRLKFRIGD
jgi:hypothetical protein